MMSNDVQVKNGIVIPEHELEISASRSGGPGGQHVNVTSSKVTVRWNVNNTQVLSPEQKARIAEKLASRLTTEGDLIVHNSASRSQEQNKRMALENLAELVRQGLIVPKKRKKTKISRKAKEKRLKSKAHRGSIKKMRSKQFAQE